jgi:hypothetical protein
MEKAKSRTITIETDHISNGYVGVPLTTQHFVNIHTFQKPPCPPKNNYVKVRVSLQHAMKAQRGSTAIALLILNLGVRWGWVPMPHPGRFTPGKEHRCPLYRRLGGFKAGIDRCGE